MIFCEYATSEQGNNLPVLFFPFRPRCQRTKLRHFKHNCDWANSRRCESVCKGRRAKITLYKVFLLRGRWYVLMPRTDTS